MFKPIHIHLTAYLYVCVCKFLVFFFFLLLFDPNTVSLIIENCLKNQFVEIAQNQINFGKTFYKSINGFQLEKKNKFVVLHS